ncbi:gluconokinase [Kitasatospora sp. NPDC094015]|uniref:gluconokinase n=1 Tax=Kitasatospora sp. NPDC094015 TaxID=3155205 RepID=UPI0033248F74
MGVSGAGKSTAARLLAERREVPFVEGDLLHPATNIARMAAGHPLDDADREPWLRALDGRIRDATRTGRGAVLSCSALKRAYRDRLRAAGPGVWFLYLALDRETARRRVAHRHGHFMPAALLDSQFAALDPLAPDEPGLTVDAAEGTPAALDRAEAALERFEAGRRG